MGAQQNQKPNEDVELTLLRRADMPSVRLDPRGCYEQLMKGRVKKKAEPHQGTSQRQQPQPLSPATTENEGMQEKPRRSE